MKEKKKDSKKSDKLGDLILIFLIFLLVFIILVSGLWYLKSDKDCKDDPMAYGIREMEKASGVDISCICWTRTPNYNPIIIDGE